MKYVKFVPVDNKTGISVLIEESKDGPKIPDISGLSNLCVDYSSTWYYGTASDDFVATPENNIYELTQEEYAQELTEKIEKLKVDLINRLYEDEKYLRERKLAPYHESATTAGILKYQEAKDYLDTGVASSSLTLESEKRGISIEDLCDKIIRKYENFRELDSKIAGLRGNLVDRIRAFAVDPVDPWKSHEEWETKEEILVEQRISTETPLSPFEEGTPEIAKYYSANLYTRYHCMEYLEQNSNVGVATT